MKIIQSHTEVKLLYNTESYILIYNRCLNNFNFAQALSIIAVNCKHLSDAQKLITAPAGLSKMILVTIKKHGFNLKPKRYPNMKKAYCQQCWGVLSINL